MSTTHPIHIKIFNIRNYISVLYYLRLKFFVIICTISTHVHFVNFVLSIVVLCASSNSAKTYTTLNSQ